MSDPTYAIIVNPASNTGRLKKKWLKVLPKVETKFNEYDLKFEWFCLSKENKSITDPPV